MASGRESNRSCTVRFDPDGVSTSVEPGTTVLDAALSCGIPIDSVCGGTGRCRRCKVRVRGISEEPSAGRPGKSVLACTTPVEKDVQVFVPQSSRIGIHQILETSEHVSLKRLSPLVKKLHFHLPTPSLGDNLSDLERIRRSIQIIPERRASIPLEVLRTIPQAVRKSDWEVTVSLAEGFNVYSIVAVEPGDTTNENYGVCIDIGTTSIVLSLIDLNTGETLSTESTYNKQIICGEDVLSRIAYAEEYGTEKLRALVMETINYLIASACESASEKIGRAIAPAMIISASVSGNPAMIHFFLGLETRNMRFEPYVPVANVPQCPRAREVGLIINPSSLINISPGRASYVGGDVLADVLASGMHLKKQLSMLIDVGTNGEIVFGGKDWMVCCSCSAGPAFEGGEVSCGMRAMHGAIDRISITRSGDLKYHTIGGTKPLGICGSGLVDLISELFINEFLDRRGNLDSSKSDRIREADGEELEFFVATRESREYVKGWVEDQPTDIALRESDIQNILRTKAAIYSGCSVLLKSLDHELSDVSQIVIAGGFGQYLDIRKAIMIGLFPDVDLKKYRFIGNGALEGARLLLLSSQKRREIRKIYRNMTYLELSVSGIFFDEFTSALFLPHTNLDRFPSIEGLIKTEQSNDG